MKTQILCLALLLAAFAGNAQNCFWAKNSGGNNEDCGQSITTDPMGNIYVTGYFQSTSITFGTTTLANPNPGDYAYFLAKYDGGGNVLWAQGAGKGTGYGVATDSLGNVYVTGRFTATSMTFDTITLNGNAVGYGDVFIVKYNSNGNALWARSDGGDSYDFGYAIAVDEGGNVYVTGSYYSPSITFGDTTFFNNGSNSTDFFISKYDSSGNIIWAHSAGGSSYEDGYGLTTVGNNVYVTGSFQSDSIRFGSTTLFNSAPGSYVLFVSEYDSAGNLVWAQGTEGLWGSVAGNAITHDITGNIYVTGYFSSVSVIFGSTTLTHSSSGGNNDIFIVKYGTGGNVIWAKGAGGAMPDYSSGIAMSNTGDLYITGYFMSNYITFGSDTLVNYGNADPDIFIAKFDSAGNSLWAKMAGGTSIDIGYAVATGTGDDVYFTGRYGSSPAYFGDISLSIIGYMDLFVADVYNFSSDIISFTNATCFNAVNGTAEVAATSGHLPYTYLWNTSPQQTTPSVNNLSAGIFTVTVTESYGCAQTHSVTIAEPPMDSAKICMVTVDSLSQHNIIVWDKTLVASVDSFIVYREISTGNYQPIARIPYDSLSQFIDTVSAQYFPNTGDPNAGTYRYKLQVHDTCGSYSDLSPYHNTIYFLNNSGTFYWTLPYTIEGGANPVSSYILLRDDNSTGNWQPVASVAGTQQTISDPLYVIYQNSASWRVKTQWGISCTPTKSATNYSYSLSNVYTDVITVGNEHASGNLINFYPNPAGEEVLISGSKQRIQNLEIFNGIGKRVYSSYNVQNPLNVSIKDFPRGIYYIHLWVNDHAAVKMFVKE